MLTLEIHNQRLAQKVSKLLAQEFENDSDKMLEKLISAYSLQQKRVQYSGILTWEGDALEYQKAIRNEWQYQEIGD